MGNRIENAPLESRAARGSFFAHLLERRKDKILRQIVNFANGHRGLIGKFRGAEYNKASPDFIKISYSLKDWNGKLILLIQDPNGGLKGMKIFHQVKYDRNGNFLRLSHFYPHLLSDFDKLAAQKNAGDSKTAFQDFKKEISADDEVRYVPAGNVYFSKTN